MNEEWLFLALIIATKGSRAFPRFISAYGGYGGWGPSWGSPSPIGGYGGPNRRRPTKGLLGLGLGRLRFQNDNT